LTTRRKKNINNNREAMRSKAAILVLLIGICLDPSGLIFLLNYEFFYYRNVIDKIYF
jgi:hypothetical protein